jgi:hypothetical protein
VFTLILKQRWVPGLFVRLKVGRCVRLATSSPSMGPLSTKCASLDASQIYGPTHTLRGISSPSLIVLAILVQYLKLIRRSMWAFRNNVCCLHLQGKNVGGVTRSGTDTRLSSVGWELSVDQHAYCYNLKLKVRYWSETLLKAYHITRHHIPEDSVLIIVSYFSRLSDWNECKAGAIIEQSGTTTQHSLIGNLHGNVTKTELHLLSRQGWVVILKAGLLNRRGGGGGEAQVRNGNQADGVPQVTMTLRSK